MDFVAHLLWSGIIFQNYQGWLSVFFGGVPDLIPFGANLIASPFRRKKGSSAQFSKNMKNSDSQARKASLIEYYNLEENKWVYRVYNYTHSLVVWGLMFALFCVIGHFQGFFPYFMFAWLLHILIDIPTHEKVFFAPQFLTPLSEFNIDGYSWANKYFQFINYALIIIGILVSLYLF